MSAHMSTPKKKMILAGGILCLVAPITWLWPGSRSAVRYRTVTADRGDVNVTVSATGNPNAVGSQVSGNILALFADFNTKVTKGELIARIDPAPFETKVNQAKANLDAARAAVANSQAVVQQALAGIQAATSSLDITYVAEVEDNATTTLLQQRPHPLREVGARPVQDDVTVYPGDHNVVDHPFFDQHDFARSMR